LGRTIVAKKRNVWGYNPPRAPKPKVEIITRASVERKATELVEAVLKPTYVKTQPDEKLFNYVVDIYTKWYGNYFYFSAKYCCPGPNARSPYFDSNFAHLEYVGGDARFNLSFMRHTGQWIEIHHNVSLDECIEAIRNDQWFQL